VTDSFAACQALWTEILLQELKVMEAAYLKLLVENKSPIDLAKHIERKFHFLRDQVNKEKLQLEYCIVELQLV
jgi:hypothetical protein